jgi:DNA (cytosine-5)-methyltransferase 1
MRFGSVCSGIEAASVAWHPLGWRAAWLAEIEPFPSAVLAHHYPEVANLGDMTRIAPRVLSGEVEAPDVLTGGTPCQAFSVAGLRRSLDDARGNLSLKFVELADAIDFVRRSRGEQPAVVIWENVPGVLSTKDNAFGCFLAGLAGEDDALEPPGERWADCGCVYGPARAIAWRTLDAQYFGLAQRRRRVFVVASARAGFDPATVLFEWEGVRRDSAPRREAREGAARGTEIGPSGGGFTELNPTLDARAKDGPIRNQLAGAVMHIADVAPTLNAAFGSKLGLEDQHIRGGGACSLPDTSQCLTTGTGQRYDPETETLIPTTGGGFDVALSIQAGALRENPDSGPDGVGVSAEGVAYTLEARAEVQAVGFQSSQSGVREVDAHATLDAHNGSRRHNGVVQAMQVRRLTPRECERLQGFPDDYTLVPNRGKDAADGPRYKALGNSWAVPCARWIGERVESHVRTAVH